jgi:hypothetical protein
MSSMAIKETAEKWLWGRRFYLRSPLNEEECKRRIGLYSSGAFIPPVTDDPVAIWKRGKVYVWMPFQRRGPWLVARMGSTGDSTEIIGRAGVDFTSLWGALALEAVLIGVVLVPSPADPLSWVLLLLPIVFYFLRRNSPHGDRLIEFLVELLGAEDVLVRKGDPIVRV